MELIWVLWFIFGLFAGVILGDMVDEREYDNDNDMRVYIPSWDRNRRGDNGSTKQVDAEQAICALQNLRLALSNREKEYIDYACECVAIREKMINKLIENMKGEKNEERNDSDA